MQHRRAQRAAPLDGPPPTDPRPTTPTPAPQRSASSVVLATFAAALLGLALVACRGRDPDASPTAEATKPTVTTKLPREAIAARFPGATIAVTAQVNRGDRQAASDATSRAAS